LTTSTGDDQCLDPPSERTPVAATYDVYLVDRCRARFSHRADAEDYRDALRRRALLAAPDLSEEDLDTSIVIETRWDAPLPTRQPPPASP